MHADPEAIYRRYREVSPAELNKYKPSSPDDDCHSLQVFEEQRLRKKDDCQFRRMAQAMLDVATPFLFFKNVQKQC
jgi:hypothetical protein